MADDVSTHSSDDAPITASKQRDAVHDATDSLIDDWTDQAEQRAWFLFESSRGA